MFNRGLKITVFALVLSLLSSGVALAVKDSLWEKSAGGITVNMGVLPANNPNIVCWKNHSNEIGVEDIRKETSHHLLFIFRDSTTSKLVNPDNIHVKVYAPSGEVVGSTTMHPEIYAGIVQFCNFFDLTQKGAYKVEVGYVSNGNSYRVNFLM